MPVSRLIFGCGYLGRRVARLWLDAGDVVTAVARSPATAAELQGLGLRPLVADILAPATLSVLPPAQTVLFAVGYDRTSPASIHDVYAGGLRNVLEALPEPPRQFVYISSTGVYGPAGGEFVDEDSPCQPQRPGGVASLAAEDALRASPLAEKAMILRLAGLYGPGRIPRVAALRAGVPIDAPAAGWLNLIHVDDAARIVVAATEQLLPPRLFVVSDGAPLLRGDYYRLLAELAAAPPPQFVEPAANSPAAQRAASDKRVNPARLYRELRINLAYPTAREGLAACLAVET